GGSFSSPGSRGSGSGVIGGVGDVGGGSGDGKPRPRFFADMLKSRASARSGSGSKGSPRPRAEGEQSASRPSSKGKKQRDAASAAAISKPDACSRQEASSATPNHDGSARQTRAGGNPRSSSRGD
ncbi:unnamed protein product, partial [Ectocarpus sp. 12 AP-2014]